jgi:hypothetical protein
VRYQGVVDIEQYELVSRSPDRSEIKVQNIGGVSIRTPAPIDPWLTQTFRYLLCKNLA